MLCEKFESLTIRQKIILVGQVTHILQSSDHFFTEISDLINKAEQDGLLDGVTIMPDTLEDQKTNY